MTDEEREEIDRVLKILILLISGKDLNERDILYLLDLVYQIVNFLQHRK